MLNKYPWIIHLLKFLTIVWVISNTGCFQAIYEENQKPLTEKELQTEALLDSLSRGEELERRWLTDSLSTEVWKRAWFSIEQGGKYDYFDYFRDLKACKDTADKYSPWSMEDGTRTNEFNQVHWHLGKNYNTPADIAELERARCEYLGYCNNQYPPGVEQPKVKDWKLVFYWLLKQYLLSLFPVLIFLLLSIKQGKLQLSPRKSSVSFVLYWLIWPLRLAGKIIAESNSARAEVHIRSEKESLFDSLSEREKSFIISYKEYSQRRKAARKGSTKRALAQMEQDIVQTVRGRNSFQLRYIMAIFAVLLVRVVPACEIAFEAISSSDSQVEITVCYDCDDPDPPPEISFTNVALKAVFTEDCLGKRFRQRKQPIVGFKESLLDGFRFRLLQVPKVCEAK